MSADPIDEASGVGACRAAVFTEAGTPLQIQTLPLPPLALGDVLVRMRQCTICGSDLHSVHGRRSVPTPTILGHECIGEVVDWAGPPRHDLRGASIGRGDLVTWSVILACGNCRRCQLGIPQKCFALRKFGHQALAPPWLLSGGMADYAHLPHGIPLMRLAPDACLDRYCPASCATATVAAALRAAGTVAGAHVLVLGAGLLGLTAAAMCRVRHAASITVSEPHVGRRERALAFGADSAVGAVGAAGENDNERYDVVLDMSGAPAAMASGLRAAATGGRIVLVGSVMPTPPLTVDPMSLVRQLQHIVGVHNYCPEDLREAVEFLELHGDAFPFPSVVEERFPLDQINRAVEFAENERPIRVAIVPDA